MIGKIIGWFFLSIGILLVLALVVPVVIGVDVTDGNFTLWVRVFFIKIGLVPQKEKKPKKRWWRRAKKRPTKQKKPKKADAPPVDTAEKPAAAAKEPPLDVEKKPPSAPLEEPRPTATQTVPPPKPALTPPAMKEKEKKQRREKKAKPSKRPETLGELITLIKRIASAAGAAMRWLLRGIFIRKVEFVLPVTGSDAAEVAQKTGRTHALVGTGRAVLENVFNIRFKQLMVIPDFSNDSEQKLHFSCIIIASPIILIIAGVAGLIKFFRWKRRTYSVEEYAAYQKEKAANADFTYL